MPLARRWSLPLPSAEFLLPLFLFLFLLIPLSGIVMFWQMIRPRPEYAELGVAEDFSEIPTRKMMRTREGEGITFWVVKTSNGWRAFDGQVRFGMMNCFFAWQPVTQRFEDPCSGTKFSFTGSYIEYYAPYPRSLARNLDEYPIFEQNGKIFVEVSRRITGAPANGAPVTPEN